MRFLLEFFTWWQSATLGLRWHLRRNAVKVGEDTAGNSYYKSKAIDKALQRERRFVIYAGQAEASAIPPGWWGWMHHRTDICPADEVYIEKAWQNPHVPNLTGTPNAWRPQGSLLNTGVRPRATGDYEAWKP
jgi:NADH:ubiquinone oxidoreductase subunit